jgi:hypothetical protein
VVNCATGHGGFIDRLLAYRFFRAPSSLSYLAYLIHPVLMLYHTGNVRERVYLSHYLFLNTFLARTVMAFAAAYLLYVTVELPFAQLERYVFPKKTKKAVPPVTSGCCCSTRHGSASVKKMAGVELPGFVSSTSSSCLSSSSSSSAASCVVCSRSLQVVNGAVNSTSSAATSLLSINPLTLVHQDTLPHPRSDRAVLRADSMHGTSGFYRPHTCESTTRSHSTLTSAPLQGRSVGRCPPDATSFVTRSTCSSSLDGHN